MVGNPKLDFHVKEAISRQSDYFNISSDKLKVSRELFDVRMSDYRIGVLKITAGHIKMNIWMSVLGCAKDYIVEYLSRDFILCRR